MLHKSPVKLALALLVGLIASNDAIAHGGGLDAYGCHNDKKNGNYHCHRGPFAGMVFSSKAEALKYFNAQSIGNKGAH